MKLKATFFIIIALMALNFSGCSKERCKYCGVVIKTTVFQSAHFDFDKAQLKPQAIPLLNENIDILKNFKKYRVTINGYTDSVGTPAYNIDLSRSRAMAVFDYLAVHGISPDRMLVIGHGEANPVAPNTSAKNRALNRRVQINIIDPK